MPFRRCSQLRPSRHCCPGAAVAFVACLAIAPGIATAQEALSLPRFLSVRTPEAFVNLDTLVRVRQVLVPAATPTPPRYSWYSPITNLPTDWYNAGDEIIRAKSIPTITMIGAATGVLLLTDHATFHASRTLYLRNSFVQHTSDAVVRMGDGTTHAAIAAGFGVYGFVARDSRAMETGGQIIEALLATGITVQLMKRISGRESPQTAPNGTSRWRPFPSLAGYQRNQPKYYSFPSGHIATTMATLTVIEENYPEAHWLRPVGYVALAGLGVSLVNVRYHWFSDLPLGLLLGYGFGKLASHHTRSADDTENSTPSHVLIQPMIERDGGGLVLAWQF